ncbi:MAG: hypothetical protein Fur007_10680 [Rhodoferax sp.]
MNLTKPPHAQAVPAPVHMGWLGLALAAWLAGALLHLQVSLVLVRARSWGSFSGSLSQAMPLAVSMLALALLVVWVRQWRAAPPARRRRLLAAWGLWLCAVWAVDAVLTFSINEAAHYPQYAGLAWLLARALDPSRARRGAALVLLLTTLLGALDELGQYLWITAHYSDYVDFNDFFTNLVAASAGVLLYYGAPQASLQPQDWPAAQHAVRLTLIALTLGAALALATQRVVLAPATALPAGGQWAYVQTQGQLSLQRAPGFFGAWQPGPRHGRYWVMPPWVGCLALLGLGVAMARLAQAPGQSR